eukprot:IDg14815t1
MRRLLYDYSGGTRKRSQLSHSALLAHESARTAKPHITPRRRLRRRLSLPLKLIAQNIELRRCRFGGVHEESGSAPLLRATRRGIARTAPPAWRPPHSTGTVNGAVERNKTESFQRAGAGRTRGECDAAVVCIYNCAARASASRFAMARYRTSSYTLSISTDRMITRRTLQKSGAARRAA